MWRILKSSLRTQERKLLYLCVSIIAASTIFYLSRRVFWKIEAGNFDMSTTALNTGKHAFLPFLAEEALPKTILYWTSFFGSKDFEVGFGKNPFKSCPVSNCVTTNNRSLLNHSDAIIFHPRDTSLDDLPPFRSPEQRWIFYHLLSPMHTPDLSFYSNFYNWTMTYRSDSDIYHPYFHVLPFSRQNPINWHNLSSIRTLSLDHYRSMKESQDYATAKVDFEYEYFLRYKTKSVAWVVSNCYTPSHREAYVRELAKYIDVDVYGNCGNLTCQRGENSCFEQVGKDYKFYLALENSVCEDYVTEKLFNALGKGVVPVVFGVDAHRKMAPPHSFIDARTFGTPQALAEYLHKLMKNDMLYTEYLQWNDEFTLAGMTQGWCKLCEALNDPEKAHTKTTYADIHAWWFKKGVCLKPDAK